MKALILHLLTLGIGLGPCLAETVPVSRSATINFTELAANERPYRRAASGPCTQIGLTIIPMPRESPMRSNLFIIG